MQNQQIPIWSFFGLTLTWPGFEPIIYHARGDHNNHYTTGVVYSVLVTVSSVFASWDMPINFQYRCKQNKNKNRFTFMTFAWHIPLKFYLLTNKLFVFSIYYYYTWTFMTQDNRDYPHLLTSLDLHKITEIIHIYSPV